MGSTDKISTSNVMKSETSTSQNDSISSSKNAKVSEAAALEVKFQKYIAKSCQLADEFKSEALIKTAQLEKQLALQQKLCAQLKKKNNDLTDELIRIKKSLLKENEDVKKDLRQSEESLNGLKAEITFKEIRINDLVKENQKLLKAKICFNDRLKMFIHDISVSEVDDLDTTMETEKLMESENSKKRANDISQPLIHDENRASKRQKTIDSQQETLSDSKNESDNQNCGVESIVESKSFVDAPSTNVKSMMIASVHSTNANCTAASNANFVSIDVNQATIENPIIRRSVSVHSRSNIRKVMDFSKLTMETKRAYQQEKERKELYRRHVKSFTETYGTLPGVLNKLDKLVLDFDPDTKQELLTVDRRLSLKLKPHQCEGVKFMWDTCFESIKKLQSSGGSGCILGHCMGLGKTLQVITLVHTLMTNFVKTKVEKVLIICPVNVIMNWVDEFEIWLKDFPQKEHIEIYELASCNSAERKKRIKSWQKNGGVFIMGYRMFQNMHQNDQQNGCDAIEPDIFHKAFINPGADLVVCDEGHLLKNPSSQLSLVINKICTLRRILLTGTPLQNNLKEYFTMIEFVKPRLLGTEHEFNNRFVRPIVNGQFIDSTLADIKLMKYRAFLLHKLLEGCVQRRNYSVLAKYLPPKQEYVLFIRLTKVQIDLYKFYMTNSAKGNPINDLPVLKRVCNHPKVLTDFKERHKPNSENKDSDENAEVKNIEWWKPIFSGDNVELSGKMLILFSILTGCQARNEKLLVFSGCLSTLNVIEHFLTAKPPVSSTDIWTRDSDYFRLDGSDSVEKRRRDITKFNEESNKRARLFLISTKAGGLGINLMAANRVVIFDASWNPSDDIQSIFRTYRFGQKKECFIYRFVALGTMEEKIYDRQVSKLSTAKRVIDEHQIDRHYKEADLQQLYCVQNIDSPTETSMTSIVTKDDLLNGLLKEHCNVIHKYHDHDSLLENVIEETLTDEEIGDVWEEFEAIESDDYEEKNK